MRYLGYSFLICGALLVGCGAPVPTADQSAVIASPQAQRIDTPTALASEQPRVSAPAMATDPADPTPTTIPTVTTVPTAVLEPKAVQPTPVPPAQGTITISAPASNAVIASPITVKGATNFWPFEATLTGQVKDAAGNVLGVGPVMVQAPDIGQGGPFEAQIVFTPPAQAQVGTLEVFAASARDGSIEVIQTVPVQFGEASEAEDVTLDSPSEGVAVTLPLHVAVRTRDPNDALVARLIFGNGVTLEQPLPIVAGADGAGYGIANLDWNTESAPPPVEPGDTTVEIARVNGTYRKQVAVSVLPESETRLIDVVWTTGDGQLVTFKQAIGAGPQIASAALRELLNGPAEGNLAGASTALPSTQEIVNYAGREANWGYEVKLIKLTIENGVATANFSPELRAYGGGAARAQVIRQQIEQTLKQFPSVQQVVIQIDGQADDVLQP